MQNSGLGNAINPLISVAHKSVYAIPMLLIIGWRGAPGYKDEPQHNTKGKISSKILKLLNIRHLKVSKKINLKKIEELINYAKKHQQPVALLIKKDLFSNKKNYKSINKNKISREKAIQELLKNLSDNTKIISSTGYISREVLKSRREKNLKIKNDFLMVGGMGHSSSVALGVSLNLKKKVICLDGDGSLLMHFGSLLTIAKAKKYNLKYILLNNGSHQSVGGQETGALNINFKQVCNGLGIKNYFCLREKSNFEKRIKNIIKSKKNFFLEIKISNKNTKDLPRPKSLIDIRNSFID